MEVVKSRCNEGIQLHESSKLLQIQSSSSSESNNNTTDSGKMIQTHLFNSCSQNSSLVIMEKENVENIIMHKTVNDCLNNYKNSQSTNNLPLLVGFKPSNELIREHNFLQNVQSLGNIQDEEDEDFKTNQAIMSLALKISQQNTNFNNSDDFDEQIINGSSLFSEQNGDQNIDCKLDEEFKITNSLKILESLVNIEHNKLETQKSFSEEELQSNIESFENTQNKMSNKTNFKKNKSTQSKEIIHKNVTKEETIKKTKSSSRKLITKKRKNHKRKSSNKKNQNDSNHDLTILSNLNDFKEEETILFTTNTFHKLEITSSVGTTLTSQNVKDNLPSNELKTHSEEVENIPVNQKESNNTTNDSNDSNTSSIKVSPISSTSSYNEKGMDNSKNKSFNVSGSPMKNSDLKKLYLKDRKSLFSPEIIIRSKPTNNSTNNLCTKKVNTPIRISDRKLSIKKTKNLSNVEKTKSHKSTKSSKSSSNQKPSNSSCLKIVSSQNKFKRLRMHKEIKINSDTHQNPLPNTEVDNNEVINIENSALENSVIVENTNSNIGTLENMNLPEWLKAKCVLYNIRPLYVVLHPYVNN